MKKRGKWSDGLSAGNLTYKCVRPVEQDAIRNDGHDDPEDEAYIDFKEGVDEDDGHKCESCHHQDVEYPTRGEKHLWNVHHGIDHVHYDTHYNVEHGCTLAFISGRYKCIVPPKTHSMYRGKLGVHYVQHDRITA